MIVTHCRSLRCKARDPHVMTGREYRITLEGELSDRAGRAFEGMTLTREDGTTVLLGRMRDQAELQGVFQRVSDLGLTLLSATAMNEAENR